MTEREETPRDLNQDLKTALDELAGKVEHIADEIGAACDRMGGRMHRIESAVEELGADLERPAGRLARALDDLASEVKRSFEKLTGQRKPRPFDFFRR